MTYDHAVVTAATTKQHAVVFAAVDGKADATVLANDIRKVAARTRGVDRDSVRSSAAPLAVSFAVDPKNVTPATAIAAIEKGASSPGVKLTLLKVIR
ncbi:MAG: hypothetical protein M3Z31_12835 [Pseudomonadota bacterium]|nr:hypothetical protein [Pseudomonadota bacterium]